MGSEFAQSLCCRMANVLFSFDAIPVLLNKMVHIVENGGGQPRALLNAGIFLLNCLCDECPKIFAHNQCLSELIKLFHFEDEKLSFVALRILSKSIDGNSVDSDEDAQSFIADLTDRAKMNTSHLEAQLATECLIRCTGKYSKCVETLCFECSKELDMTEVFLPSLLSTLALIAKLSPNIFIQRANHIMEFILETLLPFDTNEENDGIYQENKIKKSKKKKMEKMNPTLLI